MQNSLRLVGAGKHARRSLICGLRGTAQFVSTIRMYSKEIEKVLEVHRFKQPVSYLDGFFLQRQFREEIFDGKKDGRYVTDKLVVLEHPKTFTLGRRSKVSDLLFVPESLRSDENIMNLTKIKSRSEANEFRCFNGIDKFNAEIQSLGNPNTEVFKSDRGGEITHHCPGQVVCYLIFDLTNHKKDLHWLLRTMESTISSLLEVNYDIQTTSNSDHTGVWVPQGNGKSGKIAAIGLSASKWVSMHGFSLNADCDLSGFRQIVPCGISDPLKSVTSIENELGGSSLDSSRIPAQALEMIKDKFKFNHHIETVYEDIDAFPTLE